MVQNDDLSWSRTMTVKDEDSEKWSGVEFWDLSYRADSVWGKCVLFLNFLVGTDE